ncbi:TSUP family transporter, partial [Floridanema aerugineum]
MDIWEFTLLVWIGSFTAGFVGALTGLGGGVVIVPLLTSVFAVDIRYAVGASLVSVIATSSGAASAYIKQGFTNLRLGMFLEVATTMGALMGAIIAAFISVKALTIVLAVVLLYSA